MLIQTTIVSHYKYNFRLGTNKTLSLL